ncbi:hypothetical protein J1N35_041458 [Gossypium stocksii]|uniref:RNase H type-1 domain-containing protein n=1 Tax=Gossypium stocksii TaxID=47602 RepID=A0A9D3ZIN9_9ROSI|nr:hypothetical protein J1N35_041458 [Gossypium stocksii]
MKLNPWNTFCSSIRLLKRFGSCLRLVVNLERKGLGVSPFGGSVLRVGFDLVVVKQIGLLATICHGLNTRWTGLAAVARDDTGTVIDGCNAAVQASSARTVEAMAIRLGTNLISKWKWNHVIIKTDCRDLALSLKSSS